MELLPGELPAYIYCALCVYIYCRYSNEQAVNFTPIEKGTCNTAPCGEWNKCWGTQSHVQYCTNRLLSLHPVFPPTLIWSVYKCTVNSQKFSQYFDSSKCLSEFAASTTEDRDPWAVHCQLLNINKRLLLIQGLSQCFYHFLSYDCFNLCRFIHTQ